MNKKRLVPYFFFGVFLLLLYQVALILSPFFVAVLGAAIIALTLYPLHAYVSRRFKKHPNTAAGVSTAIMALIVVLPTLLFGWMFLKETTKIYPVAKHWMEDVRTRQSHPGDPMLPPQVQAAWESARAFLQFWNLDPQDIILKNLDELSANMTHIATRLIKDIGFVFFNLFVLIMTLFFFLRDGASIIKAVTELIPMSHEHKRVILERIQTTLSAVLRGVLIVSVIYGFLTGLGFATFGVPFPVLLGALATFLSPIPLVGTFAIWVPVVAGLALEGSTHQAVFVGAWCLIVLLTDHIIRPVIIGVQAKIPMLLLFLGFLGGMRVYGFIGVLLGPLIMTLLLAFINIYRQEYRWILEEVKKSALPDA